MAVIAFSAEAAISEFSKFVVFHFPAIALVLGACRLTGADEYNNIVAFEFGINLSVSVCSNIVCVVHNDTRMGGVHCIATKH